jgi:hypothetical protein
MTELLEHPQTTQTEPATIEKVAIVVSKGSLEGIYPGLIMANGARMEGIEADLFFTFFGLDAIRKDRYEKIKVATVGNPRYAHGDLDRRDPGLLRSRYADDAAADGEDRHPAYPRVHRARPRLRRSALCLQGDRGHVRADDGRLRPPGRRHHQRRRVLRESSRRQIIFT